MVSFAIVSWASRRPQRKTQPSLVSVSSRASARARTLSAVCGRAPGSVVTTSVDWQNFMTILAGRGRIEEWREAWPTALGHEHDTSPSRRMESTLAYARTMGSAWVDCLDPVEELIGICGSRPSVRIFRTVQYPTPCRKGRSKTVSSAVGVGVFLHIAACVAVVARLWLLIEAVAWFSSSR